MRLTATHSPNVNSKNCFNFLSWCVNNKWTSHIDFVIPASDNTQGAMWLYTCTLHSHALHIFYLHSFRSLNLCAFKMKNACKIVFKWPDWNIPAKQPVKIANHNLKTCIHISKRKKTIRWEDKNKTQHSITQQQHTTFRYAIFSFPIYEYTYTEKRKKTVPERSIVDMNSSALR